MYGYGAGELDGQPSSILYPTPDQHARAVDVYDALALGGTAGRIELRRRKDGSTSWNRADGRAVDFQDPHKGSVWIVEDVTEERKAAEELQRVLAEQQALLNNVVVGIQFTRERKTVRCNRRYEELFGYAPGTAVGAPTRDVYFTEQEYEQVAASYAELDQGHTHAREAWVRRQDGSGFASRLSGRPVQAGWTAQRSLVLPPATNGKKRREHASPRSTGEASVTLP